MPVRTGLTISKLVLSLQPYYLDRMWKRSSSSSPTPSLRWWQSLVSWTETGCGILCSLSRILLSTFPGCSILGMTWISQIVQQNLRYVSPCVAIIIGFWFFRTAQVQWEHGMFHIRRITNRVLAEDPPIMNVLSMICLWHVIVCDSYRWFGWTKGRRFEVHYNSLCESMLFMTLIL